MIKPQYIYLAVDYIFESSTQPKPKYFVVFHCDEYSTLLFSLTTSQAKLPADLDSPDQEGCVHFNDDRGYGHSFIWNPQREIGTNGFYFKKRTYIQLEFRAQLKEVRTDEIHQSVTEKVEECCCLLDIEFLNILKCLSNSRFLKQKHKKVILAKIQELSFALALPPQDKVSETTT